MLDPAKIRAIADIPIWIQELGVVEDVEELRAELKVFSLSHSEHRAEIYKGCPRR